MAGVEPVLIAGSWRDANYNKVFEPEDPATKMKTGKVYPISDAKDVEEAIEAASYASEQIADVGDEIIALFLERYADRMESRADEICEIASAESGFPVSPRLKDVELPRTTSQLRLAAASVRSRSWTQPTIDTVTGIRSKFGSLAGGVTVFGPNNFPLAFNSVAGGDFAAAIAAGNPVIGKGNSSHPGTTKILAEEAFSAIQESGMPTSTVQLIYRTDHEVGKLLVSHQKIGATGYTGSRGAGLVLKEAADRAGKPVYMELSSINPVYILPGALRERSVDIAEEFATSCLMGVGQFCTNPGIVVLVEGDETEQFINSVCAKFSDAPVGTLLTGNVEKNLAESITTLQEAGAIVITGGKTGTGSGYSFDNTLLRVSGETFIANPEKLQTEAFGNESLFVIAGSEDQAVEICKHFEGNLTGCIYSSQNGEDEPLYKRIVGILRKKVGRLLNDKMPTGVAVSSAMNHGGPYPATGHPGFTAVGIPASIVRFGMLESYDNVREHRLPPELRDQNPADIWRLIDGRWTQKNLGEVE
jgi:NADP-dependent aldehyde dehydrogenase